MNRGGELGGGWMARARGQPRRLDGTKRVGGASAPAAGPLEGGLEESRSENIGCCSWRAQGLVSLTRSAVSCGKVLPRLSNANRWE